MDKEELSLKNRELTLTKRAQNIGIVKFIFATAVISLIGLLLDVSTFFHERVDNDRTFLVNQIELLRESDPVMRLENIHFLKKLNGAPSTYLNNLEQETIAEIDRDKADQELRKKIDQRVKAEQEQGASEKLARAKEEERIAIQAKFDAETKATESRKQTKKTHDLLLQNAYRNERLFELNRKGYQLP